MRKPRDPSTAVPMCCDYASYIQTRTVYIVTENGRAAFETQFATADVIAGLVGCSRATAYRYMQQLPHWTVQDNSGDVYREYMAIETRMLPLIKRGKRGNPNFLNGAYQSELARRPRKDRS